LGSGSQVPTLAEEAVFAGDGDQITVVVIVDIMVMVQLRISVLQILLQVHSLDSREIGSPMAQVSTLGSKATGLGVLTATILCIYISRVVYNTRVEYTTHDNYPI